MTKSSNEIKPLKPSFFDFLEQSFITEWFSKNGKTVLYGVISAIALLLIVYNFSDRSSIKAEQSYLQAANNFSLFMRSNPAQTLESLEKVKADIIAHPELHAAYDAAIAQTLLNRNFVSESMPFAESTLTRIQNEELPFYTDFAKTTLTIAQEQFRQALDQSLALQTQMVELLKNEVQRPSFGMELFAFNLIRIAMLYQKLGDSEAELRTWGELKQYAGLSHRSSDLLKIDVQPFHFIIQKMAVGTLSLPDYISFRERMLKTKQK